MVKAYILCIHSFMISTEYHVAELCTQLKNEKHMNKKKK